MTRKHFQDLTRIRLKEAKMLLKSNNYSGAYYLAGYSIECALKARIAKKIQRCEVPDKTFIKDFYQHDLIVLMKLAGLEKDRMALERINSDFAVNWAITKEWATNSRYKTFTETEATELFKSIVSRKGGILPWIRLHW